MCWAGGIATNREMGGSACPCTQQMCSAWTRISVWHHAACCHSLFQKHDSHQGTGWGGNMEALQELYCLPTQISASWIWLSEYSWGTVYKVGINWQVCSWEHWAWFCLQIKLEGCPLMVVVVPPRLQNWKWPWGLCRVGREGGGPWKKKDLRVWDGGLLFD